MKIERNGLTAPDDVAKHIVNAVHVKGGIHEVSSIELVQWKGQIRYIVVRSMGPKGLVDFVDGDRLVRILDGAIERESWLRAGFKKALEEASAKVASKEEAFVRIASEEGASPEAIEAAKAELEAAKAELESIKARPTADTAQRTGRYRRYLAEKAALEVSKNEAALDLVRMMRAGSEESSVGTLGEALAQAASAGAANEDLAHHRQVKAEDSEPAPEPTTEPATEPEPAE